MKTKVYKVELLVIDHEHCCSEDDVRFFLENVKYSYLYPKVKSIQSRVIEEWTDDHPLNQKATCDQAYKDLFGEHNETF
jgi:hypothetical protein